MYRNWKECFLSVIVDMTTIKTTLFAYNQVSTVALCSSYRYSEQWDESSILVMWRLINLFEPQHQCFKASLQSEPKAEQSETFDAFFTSFQFTHSFFENIVLSIFASLLLSFSLLNYPEITHPVCGSKSLVLIIITLISKSFVRIMVVLHQA